MMALLKVAAMIVAAAGGLVYLVAPPPGGKLVAFAATVEALREAQGYSYRMTVSGAGRPKPETAKTYYKAPGLMRSEIEGGQIVVVDVNQGKTLYLNPATKSALLIKNKPLEKGRAGAGLGLAEEFRKLEAADGEPAGEKEIGGVKARGFRVKKRTDEMTIWVDPRTGFPVQIETVSHFQGKEVRGTLSDFVLNPDVDEALFRTEPPPGYTLRQSESEVVGGDPAKYFDVEDAAVSLLRLYADKSGGKLPPKIDDLQMFQKLMPDEMNRLAAKSKKTGIPDPEMLRMIQTMVRFILATRELKDGFGYRADGVKFGDPGKVIFWFKPKGSERYRAVYGDLHGAEVTADKLPEK